MYTYLSTLSNGFTAEEPSRYEAGVGFINEVPAQATLKYNHTITLIQHETTGFDIGYFTTGQQEKGSSFYINHPDRANHPRINHTGVLVFSDQRLNEAVQITVDYNETVIE